jgi:hypothetical protein
MVCRSRSVLCWTWTLSSVMDDISTHYFCYRVIVGQRARSGSHHHRGLSLLMDPHSTLSQFNQRPPKAGPAILNQRQMDSSPHPKSSPSLDRFAKRSPRTHQSRTHSRKLSLSSSQSPTSTPSDSGDLSRPIVTNARIKRGERLRKDMYLAFVNNALEQKTLVRRHLPLPLLLRCLFIHA